MPLTSESSEVARAIGRCVALAGTRNALLGSDVHHCDAIGHYDPIVWIGGGQNRVEDNVLHDTGRDGIGTAASGIDGSLISHNELYDTGLIARDCGGFYAWQTNGGGTVLSYNIVHGIRPIPTAAYGGVALGMGLYFDDGTGYFTAHHNVVYDTAFDAIYLHQPSPEIRVYNNTAVTTGGGWANAIQTGPGSSGTGTPGSELTNNLAVMLDDRNGYCVSTETSTLPAQNNGYFQAIGLGHHSNVGVEASGVIGDPLFVNAAGFDFDLGSRSPFIDRGMVIPGITDGFVGAAPDIGAYEVGASERPGPRGLVGVVVPISADAGAIATDAASIASDIPAPPAPAAAVAPEGASAGDGCGCHAAGAPSSSGFSAGASFPIFVLGLWAVRARARTRERATRGSRFRRERLSSGA